MVEDISGNTLIVSSLVKFLHKVLTRNGNARVPDHVFGVYVKTKRDTDQNLFASSSPCTYLSE